MTATIKQVRVLAHSLDARLTGLRIQVWEGLRRLQFRDRAGQWGECDMTWDNSMTWLVGEMLSALV